MRTINIILLVLIPITLFASEEGNFQRDMVLFDNDSTSWPFQSRLVVNPVIQEMVDLVSPEVMISNLETLVGFHTRHTNSDTVSSETGIGAARRWIFDRFEQYGSHPDAFGLDAGYFSFEANICAAQGEHKNVMATLTGVETPFRYFVDMGHMDSRTVNVCDEESFAPSANDDGSGTVVAMEMARVMSRFPFESTVIIMIVTGEDQGLFGSEAYAQWASWSQIDINAAITNDVVGNIEGCENPSCPPEEPVIIDSTSVRHFSGLPSTGMSRQLTRYMKLKAIEYVEGFSINLIPALDRPGRSGDHVPFYQNGYPAARFTEAHENGDGSGNNGRQHNEYDLISDMNTNAGYMANIARINIAGMASLALAPANPSGLEAADMGDGQRVFLTWSDEHYEPDFAGYRIAVRPVDDLFYSEIVDAGEANEYIVDGLNDGETIYLSVSAYDIDGNESLFCEEIEFTPMRIPSAPEDLEATSKQNGVYLNWAPNGEIDIAGYKIYRREQNQNEPDLIGYVDHPITEWTDDELAPHILYSYYVLAIDDESFQSQLAGPVVGQLATHDIGILIVDGTLNGGGNPYQPTDEQVDQYYNELTSGFNVSGYWDIVDSASIDLRLQDAHLAPYSVVLIHSDRAGSQLHPDTTQYRKYLQNGGALFVGGWNLSLSMGGSNIDSVDFPQGSFFEDYLKVDRIKVSSSQNRDFISAPSLMPSIYPDLIIDSLKAPLFDNRLFKMEAFFGPLIGEPVTEPLFSYESSMGDDFPLHGQPVGLRYIDDDYRLVLIDVPLFLIKQEVATQVIGQALNDLGEVNSGSDENEFGKLPDRLKLASNYPNPFNASTTISFDLPEPDIVELAIYNLLGQKVVTLINRSLPAGNHSFVWNAGDSPSGIYFARIITSAEGGNIRMVLLK
ncbi:MAG: M28 family peptidase [candidate division Zixibacteria bacterium]